MIQTINPCATARTAEIMSRYRPIAPKPEAPPVSSTLETENGCESDGSGMPQNIRKSAYLRNVWAHLQAQPTRTRKRGRSSAFPPPSVKRSRSCLQRLPAGFQVSSSSPAKNLAMHGFAHTGNAFSLVPINCSLDAAVNTLAESVALPLIRYADGRIPVSVNDGSDQIWGEGIDLNVEGDEVPKELDFMPQLKEPVKPCIITPQPIRPVGSRIVVKSVTHEKRRQEATSSPPRPETEKQIEEESLPVIISDSNNKVRMTNSAYKEMVGQPECCWLDCLEAACGGAWKRIGGEVVLQYFGDTKQQITSSMQEFSCLVSVEWEGKGGRRSVDGVCDVVSVGNEDKNRRFVWRFHKGEASSQSGCNGGI